MWLKCRTPCLPLPPREYPPAVRGRAPPVRFGRRVDAKGAAPLPTTALLVFETGKEARLDCPMVPDAEVKVRVLLENQRCWERD